MNKKKTEDILDLIEKYKIFLLLLSFIVIYLIIFTKIDIRLLFKDTILTGGDSASWYQTAKTMKEQFIPNGRLFGWTLANFFGYNELQYYFTIPFLISVILSIFMPLTVALKITTILGILTLPVSFYFAVDKITKNIWVSLSASFLSLIFIFNESYTMFGGNILSTFAGEFSHSISISFFVFFIGVCYETFEKNKNPVLPGILLGLVGLCHLFTFMVAFFVPFFFIFSGYIVDFVNKRSEIKKKKGKKQIIANDEIQFSKETHSEKILLIYIVGFLIMSFWLIPLIFTRGYSQTISMIWNFPGKKAFFQQTFFGLIFLGFALNLFVFFNSKKTKVLTLFILYMYLTCTFFYIISTYLEVPDIRFIPPALIISIFSVTFFLNFLPEYFFNKPQILSRPVIFIICIIGSILFVNLHPKNVSSWFNWNYSGYEQKKEWGNLEKIIKNYSGDENTGRILWEKQNQNDNADFGSERAFENLHLFTGRPSSEGVHYGSSFMARATTYMQSEYSQSPVDPEANRLYSIVNPDVWATRFYMTNTKDIILYSNEIKQKFKNHPDFEKTGEFGKFAIYTFKKFPKSYIRVVDNENFSVIKSNKYGFKTDFYRAFRDYELFDYPFITSKYAKGTSFNNIFISYDEYKSKFFDKNYNFDQWLENYKYKQSITEEDVKSFKIKFTTSEVGKPHIIGVTYSPNFKSKNGEKIYPVSPGFMMIIPQSENVTIYFGRNIYEIIGIILTLLVIPVIIFRKKLCSISIPYIKIINRVAISAFIVLVCFFLFISLSGPRKKYKDLEKAENYFYKLGQPQRALDLVNRYATLDYLDKYDNAMIYNYYMLKIRILVNQRRNSEAKKLYDYITTRYNHSRYNENNRMNIK